MYNGIGLQTPRGSGTSGYVQKNLSHITQQLKTRDSFLKELKALKENVISNGRSANPEIIQHQQKRQIELKLLELQTELEEQKLSEKEIETRIKLAREMLKEKLANEEIKFNATDQHAETLEKEKHLASMRKAFGLPENYSVGSAFDYEAEKKRKLEQKYERTQREKKRFEREREERRQRKTITKDKQHKSERSHRNRSRSR